MGRVKSLLPLGSHTFLSRIVATLREADVEDVVVVLGYDADAIRAVLEQQGSPVRIVVNPAYEAGQLSSLAKGLDVVDRPGVVAALVTLVDVPVVAASTVRAVIGRYRHTHAPVVRPRYRNRFGHPLLVDRSLFEELRRADPASGARAIVRAHATVAGTVEVDDEGAIVDVDTPEEYEALVARVDGAGMLRRDY